MDYLYVSLLGLLIFVFVLVVGFDVNARDNQAKFCESAAPDGFVSEWRGSVDGFSTCVFSNGLDPRDINYIQKEFYNIDNKRLGKEIEGRN